MEKTHKLLIKGKIFLSLNKDQANSMYNRLMKEDLKIKIHDKENNTFLYPYISDVVLQKLDNFEKIIENSNLTKEQKNTIYYIIKSREDERKRINENIIQNIIDEIIKLDEII